MAKILSSFLLKTSTFTPEISRTHLGSEFHRLHAVQAKERSLAFFAFPLIGKVGILHLHPCLICMLKVKPILFDMFGTISSFVLHTPEPHSNKQNRSTVIGLLERGFVRQEVLMITLIKIQCLICFI